MDRNLGDNVAWYEDEENNKQFTDPDDECRTCAISENQRTGLQERDRYR